jgi:predicted exporter
MRKKGPFARERWAALALLILLVFAGLALAYRIQAGRWVEGGMMALLPPMHREPAVQNALDALRARLDRQVVLLVGHAQRDQAKLAATRLSRELAATAGVAHVQGALSETQQRAWIDFYGQSRYQLLTPELRALLSRQQGKVWVERVLAQLYSPMSGVGSRELTDDPFLLLRHYLLYLGERGGGKFQIEDGLTLLRDGTGNWYVLVVAELGFDPYSIEAVREFAGQFEANELALKRDFPGIVIQRRGVAFFANHGAQTAQREVSIIGIGSMLGCLAIALLAFRSVLPLVLVLLAGAAGLLAAFSITLLVTGPLHLLTLVFGSSLVGVADDYPVHYLSDRLVAGRDHVPKETLRRIARPLTFCLITSVMAYLALLAAPTPVLRQIAIFSAIGLTVTFGVVMLWFPILAARPPTRSWRGTTPFHLWQSAGIRFARYRAPILIGLGVVLLGLTVGINVDDDVRQLQALPRALVEQESLLKRLTGIESGTQVLLVQGGSAEEMLQRLEETGRSLDTLKSEGALDGYRSLSGALPSLARQAGDQRLLKAQLVEPEFQRLSAALGLDPGIKKRILDQALHPLLPEAWLASPVSQGLRNFFINGADGAAYSVVVLHEVRQPARIAQAFEQLPKVEYIDVASEVTRLLRTYRQRVAILTAAAYAVILVLLARFHGARRALLILAPPLLGGAAGLALLHLLGLSLNLFSLFGVVLVLGAGIDYPLILAENKEHHPATQISVPYSAATTLLSFGLLSLSSTPALANFGLVVVCGITVSFLLAPVALPAQDAETTARR